MPKPQLNLPNNSNCYFTINYQSNIYLNEELNNQVKQKIAEILVKNMSVKEIHSYIHGEINIAIETDKPVTAHKKIIDELNKPLADYKPELLFSVHLIAYSGKHPSKISYIYVSGDDEMNDNFLESIKDFFPYPKK